LIRVSSKELASPHSARLANTARISLRWIHHFRLRAAPPPRARARS
jgi:hypothetical protein